MKKIANLSIFISIFIAVMFFSVLLTAYFEGHSRPELVCSPFTERKGSYVRYCVPNPFRDKEPEHKAENLFQNLKNNQLGAVLPYLRSGGKEPEKDVGKEKDLLPVFSWRIINREIERDGRYRISYVYRQKNFGNEIPIGFYFIRNEGTWKLDEIVGFW